MRKLNSFGSVAISASDSKRMARTLPTSNWLAFILQGSRGWLGLTSPASASASGDHLHPRYTGFRDGRQRAFEEKILPIGQAWQVERRANAVTSKLSRP